MTLRGMEAIQGLRWDGQGGERRQGLLGHRRGQHSKGFPGGRVRGQQCPCGEVMRRKVENNALGLPVRWAQGSSKAYFQESAGNRSQTEGLRRECRESVDSMSTTLLSGFVIKGEKVVAKESSRVLRAFFS